MLPKQGLREDILKILHDIHVKIFLKLFTSVFIYIYLCLYSQHEDLIEYCIEGLYDF